MKSDNTIDTKLQKDGSDLMKRKNPLEYMPKTQTDLRLSDLVAVYNMIDEIYGKKLSEEDWRKVYGRLQERLGPDFKEKMVDILVYGGISLLGPMACPHNATPVITDK